MMAVGDGFPPQLFEEKFNRSISSSKKIPSTSIFETKLQSILKHHKAFRIIQKHHEAFEVSQNILKYFKATCGIFERFKN